MYHVTQLSAVEATTASKHAPCHARSAMVTAKWAICANDFRVTYIPGHGPGGTS